MAATEQPDTSRGREEEEEEEEVEDPVEEEEMEAVAGVDIPAGSCSSAVAPADLTSDRTSRADMQVWVRAGGRLEGNSQGWPSLLPLAADCQEQNLQLRMTGGHRKQRGSLVVVAIRHIRRGDPLRLWFDDQLTLKLRLPFLTPANIQGGGRYLCLRCGRVFEAPNPLKVHLALKCGALGRHRLWRRLCDRHEGQGKGQSRSGSFALFLARALPPPPPLPPPSTPPLTIPYLTPPSLTSPLTSGASAFRPLRPRSMFPHPFPLPLSLSIPHMATVPPPSPMPSSSSASASASPASASSSSSPHNPHAHVEALVSSLGRSKHGHLCLYCGKLYSRKYGLKIHLRTHTGYKPLKCKVCLRPFGDPSNLNKHVRLHAEGDTPYRCEHCGKVLVRRRDLERHIRSRHPQQAIEEEEEVDEGSGGQDALLISSSVEG